METRRRVQERYCKANGYSNDADVIYGDTDSVGGRSVRGMRRLQPLGAAQGWPTVACAAALLCHSCPAWRFPLVQVMVYFGVDDVATAMKLGEEAAAEVSKAFIQPIKLEFEKVGCPPGGGRVGPGGEPRRGHERWR